MDQVKIGKFISNERKAKGYTQKQLSELLAISDKTISKWEIKQLLDKFDEAYEDQFSKVLNAQLMDLDAEMKVMKQNMAADGIQTEPPKVEPQAKRSDDLVGTIIDLADQFLNTKRK